MVTPPVPLGIVVSTGTVVVPPAGTAVLPSAMTRAGWLPSPGPRASELVTCQRWFRGLLKALVIVKLKWTAAPVAALVGTDAGSDTAKARYC
jgi:hypothetical protein